MGSYAKELLLTSEDLAERRVNDLGGIGEAKTVGLEAGAASMSGRKGWFSTFHTGRMGEA